MKKYEAVEIELVVLFAEDVITTSGGGNDLLFGEGSRPGDKEFDDDWF